MSTVLHLPANGKTIKPKNLLIEIKIVLPPINHFHNKELKLIENLWVSKNLSFGGNDPQKIALILLVKYLYEITKILLKAPLITKCKTNVSLLRYNASSGLN